MPYLLISILLLFASPVLAQSRDDASRSTEELRDEISATLSGNPDDPELRQAADRLLRALDQWEAQTKIRHSSNEAYASEQQQVPGEQRQKPVTSPVQPTPVATPMEGLDLWNLNENYLAVGAADVDWTMDRNRYPGTKLALAGRYSFVRGQARTETPDCD